MLTIYVTEGVEKVNYCTLFTLKLYIFNVELTYIDTYIGFSSIQVCYYILVTHE